MLADSFIVDSKNVIMKGTKMISTYTYETSKIKKDNIGIKVIPIQKKFEFQTETEIPKVGVMFVGWGGNNGTTVTSGILANRHSLKWDTKRGEICANYYGSLTQCSTTYLGQDKEGNTYVAPFKALLPMINPNNLYISGWDISKENIYEATKRAKVLEPSMFNQLKDELEKMEPLPAIFDLSFVAPNQKDRADNIIKGDKQTQLETVRKNIRDFKNKNGLKTVIIFWTANTERYCEVNPKIHGTSEALLQAIKNNESEISPSTIYATAAMLEHSPYINGSPQNTFVPGLIELAEREGTLLMGDDMKTGQTKLKSVMADFLVSSGLKLTAVASYNHLGNNDGLNLDDYKCFRSKEISKASVIDDIIGNNPILYPNNSHPDHVVVIKYIPSVGDSKRALDEYDSSIFCGGENIISIHNTCEDSLLAAPLMVDIIVLMELFTRVYLKDETMSNFKHMACIHSVMSFLFKAPRTPNNSPVINALFQQRACLENILRATRGLQPLNHMHLEWKLPKKESTKILDWETAQKFCTEAFVGVGVPREEAEICTDILLEADRRGIESHGCNRFKPIYLDRIKMGIQNPKTNFEIIKETETTAVIDGHDGMGQVIGYKAMKLAIEKAKKHGMGMVVVRNSCHYGIAGYYGTMASKEGCISFNGTNARPSVAPTFGVEGMFGTNPLTIGIPSDEEFDFLIDCATSITQNGKIEYYARIGEPIHPGTVVDQKGIPLEGDSGEALKKIRNGTAALLPLGGIGEELGGYKGFGYAVAVEILSSALQDGQYLKSLNGVNEKGEKIPYHLGHYFIAIDTDHFLGEKKCRKITGDILRKIRTAKKQPGFDRIFTAGEKEWLIWQKRKNSGVPINPSVQKEMSQIRDELNLNFIFPWEK